MKTSNKGIDLIKKYEGFRAKAYRCPADVWTIGYGHTLNVKSTDVIDKAQAEAFLRQDVVDATNQDEEEPNTVILRVKDDDGEIIYKQKLN